MASRADFSGPPGVFAYTNALAGYPPSMPLPGSYLAASLFAPPALPTGPPRHRRGGSGRAARSPLRRAGPQSDQNRLDDDDAEDYIQGELMRARGASSCAPPEEDYYEVQPGSGGMAGALVGASVQAFAESHQNSHSQARLLTRWRCVITSHAPRCHAGAAGAAVCSAAEGIGAERSGPPRGGLVMPPP